MKKFVIGNKKVMRDRMHVHKAIWTSVQAGIGNHDSLLRGFADLFLNATSEDKKLLYTASHALIIKYALNKAAYL